MQMGEASEFKARCLALMDEVARTGESLVITKNGKPVAELRPLAVSRRKTPFGAHKGLVESKGISSRHSMNHGRRWNDPARHPCAGLDGC